MWAVWEYKTLGTTNKRGVCIHSQGFLHRPPLGSQGRLEEWQETGESPLHGAWWEEGVAALKVRHKTPPRLWSSMSQSLKMPGRKQAWGPRAQMKTLYCLVKIKEQTSTLGKGQNIVLGPASYTNIIRNHQPLRKKQKTDKGNHQRHRQSLAAWGRKSRWVRKPDPGSQVHRACLKLSLGLNNRLAIHQQPNQHWVTNYRNLAFWKRQVREKRLSPSQACKESQHLMIQQEHWEKPSRIPAAIQSTNQHQRND